MEDYREAQRRKWEKAKQEQASAAGSAASGAGGADSSVSATTTAAASSSAAPAAPSSVVSAASGSEANPTERASTGDVSSTTGQAARPVRKAHILPVGSSDVGVDWRLNAMADELRRKRSAKELVKTGTMIRSNGRDFIVVKCEPEDGYLASETDYFVEGEPVIRFEKVQFICLWDFESSNVGEDPSRLFTEYVSPYFRSRAEAGEDVESLVTVGDTLKIFDLEFQVMAAHPSPPEVGIVDSNTMVYVDWDSTPEFEKIHIVPFQDTLPNAYEFDVFNDYLKPYLTRHKHNRFNVNDQFTFQGVQFKVVCCEPVGPARVGKNTMIYCEGMLHPSLRNLLPPELLEQLSHLPPGLQMLLLNTEALAGGYEERLMEVQEMLSRRRGMAPETLERVEKFRWDPSTSGNQTQCMVCLSDFERGEEVRRLPCTHVFHAGCIEEWLKRCAECPICKTNIDRAVQGGGGASGSQH